MNPPEGESPLTGLILQQAGAESLQE